MTHSVIGLLLALQNAPDEDTANRLIDRLRDPYTRALARKEWRELHAAAVTRIEES